MTLDDVRQLALSLPGATEEPHFDAVSYRIRGKIFATVPPGGEFLNVFVAEQHRASARAEHPDFIEALRWGKRVVGIRVLLPGASRDMVQPLLTRAWAQRAPRRLLGLVTATDPAPPDARCC